MTKCQIVRFPVQRTRLHILKQYHFAACHHTRPTLSILSPFTVASFPPAHQSDKLSLCQEATIPLYKARTNRRLGHSSWQPITKLHLTSLATQQTIWWTAKRRGVSFVAGAWRGYITPWCSRAYRKNIGGSSGRANNKHVCILPHWPISKHNKKHFSHWKIRHQDLWRVYCVFRWWYVLLSDLVPLQRGADRSTISIHQFITQSSSSLCQHYIWFQALGSNALVPFQWFLSDSILFFLALSSVFIILNLGGPTVFISCRN